MDHPGRVFCALGQRRPLRAACCACRQFARLGRDRLVAGFEAHYSGAAWAAMHPTVRAVPRLEEWLAAEEPATTCNEMYKAIDSQMRPTAVAWRVGRTRGADGALSLAEAWLLIRRALYHRPIATWPVDLVGPMLGWLVFLVNVTELRENMRWAGLAVGPPNGCWPLDAASQTDSQMFGGAMYDECDHVHNGFSDSWYLRAMKPSYIKSWEANAGTQRLLLRTREDGPLCSRLPERYEGVWGLMANLSK